MIKNTLIKRLIAWMLCLLLTPVWGAERTTYYHLDLLGSPVAATDSSGQVVWREEYKPYGERTLGQDQSTSAPGYTGKVHEEALGLSYYGARWYDPELGRFTGIDPAGFQEANIQSFNRYAYANNNPYKYNDPDGQSAELAILVGVAAILYFSLAVLPGHDQRIESLRQGLKAFNENSESDDASANNSSGQNSADSKRKEDQRQKRNDRRNNKARKNNGQTPHNQGKSRNRKDANKGPRGERPSGPDRRNNRERNKGIDEEHSKTPKGTPAQH